MLVKFIQAIVIAALGMSAAFAGSASKEENVGVGFGATIGAVAGGPVGLVVGAAIGAKFGDSYHRKGTTIAGLTANLDESKTAVTKLEQDVRSLRAEVQTQDSEIVRLRETASPELAGLLKEGIVMDLLFRTDEDQLSATTAEKLQELATTLSGLQDVNIQLDGYADQRGNTEYNQALSVRRAEHVREMLLSHGVEASRIQLAAHGEVPAMQEDIDSYAFDRKVSLTLFVSAGNAFASNPR